MPRIWGAMLAAVLAICLAACASPAGGMDPVPSDADRPHRGFLYLAPAPGDTPSFLPAFRGAEVALAVAALEGDTATVTWIEIPADLDGWRPPAADGAIVAPGTPPDVVLRLASLLDDVPTVSLAGGPTDAAWRSLAAGDTAIAEAMLAEGGDAPCLVVGADGRAFSATVRSAATGATAPARLRAGAVLRTPARIAGCSAILWPGAGESGAGIRQALVDAGFGEVPFIASDRIRDGDFEMAAGDAGRDVIVVSGAADVATLLDLRSRRFVQDYQSQVGLPPGPFSAEGWDAATLLLEVLREGWPAAYAGIGGRYDLVGPGDPPVIAYRLTRAGWRAR